MKGQMFLIAAIIIAMGLISMKMIYDIDYLFEEDRYVRYNNIDNLMENLEREYNSVLSFSKSNGDFYNFSKYVTSENRNIDIFYVFVDFTDSGNYLYTGNFLGSKIFVNISSPTNSSFYLNNSAYYSEKFDKNYTFNLTYNGKKARFNISKERDILFTDFRISQDNMEKEKTNVYRGLIEWTRW